MLKILITGAAGFIGYHLSRSLLEDGIIVFGVVSPNNNYCTDLKICNLAMFLETMLILKILVRC